MRVLERLELLRLQITAIEDERDAAREAEAPESPGPLLLRLRAIGPEGAAVLAREAFYRRFENRRQVASFGGLAPSPWQSGRVERDQGISKAGNAHLRKTMIQLAWLWRRHQPASALSRWFRERAHGKDKRTRRILIVALARKLLVALWRYVSAGIVPEGAVFKAA
jgi:transposase